MAKRGLDDDLNRTLKTHLGLILCSLYPILNYIYHSDWWLSLVVIGVSYTIILNFQERNKEIPMYLLNLIVKRVDEFRGNILNSSEKSCIFYVNAPYRYVKHLPPWMNVWEKYWDERYRSSDLRYTVKFEHNFEDAKKNLKKDELEMCFHRLCGEVRHYFVSLHDFSNQFINYRNNGDLKNWFFEVVDIYNTFVNKLEDDARDLKVKLSKEINTNLSIYNKKDWDSEIKLI